jgi:hypothetical protein
MGKKPGDIISDGILEKYDKSGDTPFEIPSAAFTLFQNTITKLYDTEIISQENLEDKIVIKLKSVCAFRNVIKSRKELEYGGTLCEFTAGYFETALKKLTGMTVEYRNIPQETNDDFCVIKLIFFKKEEPVKKTTTEQVPPPTDPSKPETEN